MLSFPLLRLLLPHQGSALDLLGGWGEAYNALQTPCWFFHVFGMRNGLRPFTNSIWNTKTVVWQSAWRNPYWESYISNFPLLETIFSQNFLYRDWYILASKIWFVTSNPSIAKMLLRPWHILLTVLVSQRLV